MLEKFKLFWGPYSQWEMHIIYDPKLDFTFNCCEQYMMYHKATLFGDTEMAEKIMECTNPREQKKMGLNWLGIAITNVKDRIVKELM